MPGSALPLRGDIPGAIRFHRDHRRDAPAAVTGVLEGTQFVSETPAAQPHAENVESLVGVVAHCDHIAANLSIEPDDFEYAPFSQQGDPARCTNYSATS